MSTSSSPRSFCSAPLPKLLYASPRTREEFDRVSMPETVYNWQADATETLLRHDGQQYERQTRVKVIEDKSTGVEVILQWHDYRAVAQVAA